MSLRIDLFCGTGGIECFKSSFKIVLKKTILLLYALRSKVLARELRSLEIVM